jgi:DNA-binding NarL/FixJ family response regulator
MGDAARAHRHATQAPAAATEPRRPLALLTAHRLLGELDADARRDADARAQFHVALALADVCAAPYERALTLLARATFDAATGDPNTARTALDEARTICSRLAARLDASALSYPAGLSTREVEVLRLVAQGLTNPQVAERLLLSRRTVEIHLRNIFDKTGASSRAAATRWAAEHDLL